MRFGFDWPSGFREEGLLKWFTDGRCTDRRWLDGYTISSPCDPNGSGEIKDIFSFYSMINCMFF